MTAKDDNTRRPATQPDVPASAAPLIALLDRLAGLTAEPDPPEEPVLDWVRRSVLAALAASGVVPVEDSGPVDPARHSVVATRDAPSGLRCDAIAETVRPGYLWGEALLRPQEVVAYVLPGEPEPSEASELSEEGGTPDE